MQKICTIGSMTLDLFVKPKDLTIMRFCRKESSNEEYMALPYGGKIGIEEVHEKFGGGAHNTAVGLSRLGVLAIPVGSIGTDAAGEKIEKNLIDEHIPTTFLERNFRENTGFSVIVSSFEGERTVLYHSGANESLQDFPDEVLKESAGIFFNHLACSGEAAENIFQKIKHHFVAFPEKFIAWNPGKEQISAGAMAYADFFPVIDLLLLNQEEAETFTGRKAGKRFIPSAQLENELEREPFPETAADYREIFQVFIRQGVRNIVITDSVNGAQLCDGKMIYFCGIDDSAARIDTLGAGDAFGSALFYALFHQKELPFALKCATINAASVVSQIGAQAGLLTESELLARTERTEIFQAQQKFFS